jgi:hypothetical protein
MDLPVAVEVQTQQLIHPVEMVEQILVAEVVEEVITTQTTKVVMVDQE